MTSLAKGLTADFPALAASVFKEKYDVLNREDGTPDTDRSVDVYRAAFDRGLLVNIPTTQKGKHSAISLKPPITITLDEIDESMEIMDDALKSLYKT